MSETIGVSVSGSVFSLLFYENIKSEHDQEGFILGNIISKETKKLTDADHRIVNREITIKVKSVLPCPHLFYFYNASGKIDAEKLNNFLGNHCKDVIGWYLFKRKRTSSSKITFREKIIHKQLAEFFKLTMPHFTCCLLTEVNSDIRSTYSFTQTFIRYNRAKYESLPLHILNLSDPCYTFKAVEPASEVVNNLVKSVKSSGESEGHLIVKKLQDGLQNHIKNLIERTVEKEQQLFKLEQEVKQLKQNLKWKREYEADSTVHNSTVVENGTLESMDGEKAATQVEISPESSRRRRGRPRREIQNNNSKQNTIKDSDISEGKKIKEITTPKTRALRHKANVNYSETPQKKN